MQYHTELPKIFIKIWNDGSLKQIGTIDSKDYFVAASHNGFYCGKPQEIFLKVQSQLSHRAYLNFNRISRAFHVIIHAKTAAVLAVNSTTCYGSFQSMKMDVFCQKLQKSWKLMRLI